jgi:hypothetical protein
MQTKFLTLAWLMIAGISPATARGQPPQGGMDPARVEQIAAMMHADPFGFGPTIEERAAWEKLARSARLAAAIERAEKLASDPIPELPDELYLEFSRNGNRENYQSALGKRTSRIAPLVVAECVEGNGRFIAPIEALVGAICAQRSWVLPAHDPNLETFNGTRVTIDLGASHIAAELAQLRYMLGDRLSRRTRELLDENLRCRVIDPFVQTVRGERAAEWWFTGQSNWNAVCLANVACAALATIQSRDDRALVAAAAEKYSLNFLHGFTPDGYCSEGLAYWNYGFSHYARLCELLLGATNGKLNLYDRQRVREIALFPSRLEIINGIYPAYADCRVGTVPSAALVALLDRRVGLGDARGENKVSGLQGDLVATMMYATAEAGSEQAATTRDASPARPIRSYFEQAQVLACRPNPRDGGACRLAVSLKGGHNDEQHNHNDVGSYVVVAGSSALLLDPGPEIYTRRTFSKDRYQSRLINSFGHAVPLVAGTLQRTGREAHAEVVEGDFTDAADTFVLDIRSCYDVPALAKLRRSFAYNRSGEGSLRVTDDAEFTSPQTFGTALVTLANWKQLSPTEVLVFDQREGVRVQIDTGGAAFSVDADQIDEQVHTPTKPTRIGINLKQSATHATIAVTISPARAP